MKKPQPLGAGLAFLFLALLIAGLIARFWTSDRAYGFTGPTHITAGGEHVYLFASGDIYRLTHAGKLLNVIPRQLTGLSDDPIDLRVSADGKLLIAEQQPAAMRLCDVNSWVCRPIGTAIESVIERQFKVLSSATPNELLLTDARGDTLWRMSGPGGKLQKLVPDGTLANPNDMAFDKSGNLWVADTDHRKIVELLAAGNGNYIPGRQHSAMNGLTIGKRFYPMMLARTADGRWWVTQASEFSEPYSDLLVYDPDDGVQALIDLPDGAYATDIVALGDTVLVTDLERFTVYQVQSNSLEVGEFGDEHFRRRLAQIHEHRNYYNRLGDWSLAAIILFAALMILSAIWATPRERRWTRPAALFDPTQASGQVPRTSGIHWLERDPKIDRSLKWLEQLGFILFIALVAGALVLYLWVRVQAGPDPGEELGSKFRELGIILLLIGVLLALIIPFIRFSTRAMRRKLGTDGKRLHIQLEDGRQLAADPSQLSYTGRVILYRQYTLPLQGGKQQPLYLPGEVETWLAPLLRQSRKLTATQAMKHQWNNRDSMTAWLLLAGAVMGLVLILITMLSESSV
jgi:sugar lactone lactonase YvrE